uniref:Uncharacterized protein n=1 Tax=Anguilla anguilla TaxID=7936 RepID=A0A0E9RF22_ANGAN
MRISLCAHGGGSTQSQQWANSVCSVLELNFVPRNWINVCL